MFDSLVAATAGASGAGAVDAWSRVENAACARRVAAMVALLDAAHAADGSASRDQWCIDNWAAVCAHVGAAQRITSGAASALLLVGVSLQERFPTVAAIFAQGSIGYPLVRAIVTRAALVVDSDALHALDAALAAALEGWEPMSREKTERTIDAVIAAVDPQAVRRTQTRAQGRSVQIYVEDGSGLATVYATLFTHDAKALDTQVNALADTVCPADPRTTDQRRADAVGALSHGADRLACRCDTADCPAAPNPPTSGVVVYLVAPHDTITGPAAASSAPDAPDTPEAPDIPEADADADECAGKVSDDTACSDTASHAAAPSATVDHPASPAQECARLHGEPPPMFTTPLRELTLAQALTPTPGYLPTLRPAAMMGGQLLPGAIARHAALGATIIAIVHPGPAPPEPRHRPSSKLADFVRCRDLTCRFPGCHEPATKCDVDREHGGASLPVAV